MTTNGNKDNANETSNETISDGVKEVKKIRWDIPAEPIIKVENGKCVLDYVGIVHNPARWEQQQKLLENIATLGPSWRPGAVLLPTEPEPYESEESLDAEILAFIDQYLELQEGHNRVVAAFIKLTWVFDCFGTVPYLRFRHLLYGVGKSRALDIVMAVSYRGTMISGGATNAGVRRIIDLITPTLCIDEGDIIGDDPDAKEYMKILRVGNQPGRPHLANKPKGRDWQPAMFDLYCPKVIAHHLPFSDVALESRFIDIEMPGVQLRADIPGTIPQADFDTTALTIRSKLLMYRIRNYRKLDLRDVAIPTYFDPRMRQVITPLLQVSDDETVAAILELSEGTQQRLQDLASDDNRVTVAKAILAAYDRQGTNRLSLRDIGQELGIIDKSKLVAQKVRDLGFATKRLTNGPVGIELNEYHHAMLQKLVNQAEGIDPSLN